MGRNGGRILVITCRCLVHRYLVSSAYATCSLSPPPPAVLSPSCSFSLSTAAPPPPKTYEENFPSLGGKPAKAAAAPPPKKDHAQNFANLAKSWATTTAEEEAVAAAQRAEREKEANRQAYNDDIYHKLMVRRAAAVTTGSAFDEPDYNDEFYPTQEPLSHDEYEGRPYSPHSPPYSGNPDEEW